MTYIHTLKSHKLHVSFIFDLSTRLYLQSFTCHLSNFKYKRLNYYLCQKFKLIGKCKFNHLINIVTQIYLLN
jgi:hypothetical protein